jgi:hypothetical protein
MTNILEVQEYQEQVSFVESKANELVISSPEDMVVASDLLNDLKKVETAIVERKTAITRPLMTALASARDLFKPLETGYASAKTTIKSKMLSYAEAEEARITKEAARVEKRVAGGTMRPDTAMRKIEEAGEVKKTFDGTSSKTSIRIVTKVRIVDESQIPREYLVPDMTKITNAILRDKQVISGIETYAEKSIVGSSR